MINLLEQKAYKSVVCYINNNLRIVSMIPGDRKVAGRFIFSSFFGGSS